MPDLDMYSDQVADASALIREFAKTEYYHYFQGDPEKALQAFIAMQAAAEAKSATRIAELERDAARYRWLRECDWFDSALCVLRDPKKALTSGAGLGADCPSRERLDDAIDAAMSTAPQTTIKE